jgi:E1-E2 ATPase
MSSSSSHSSTSSTKASSSSAAAPAASEAPAVVGANKTSTRTTTTPSLSQDLRALLQELGTSLDTGLTHDQVRSRRAEAASSSSPSSYSNMVDPPVRCPAWVCCLLPCIKNVPSMKAYRSIVPSDAEVMRSKRWVRYDATSLLVGDVIRIEAGDVVPADCVVVVVVTPNEPLLVDLKLVTGQAKPVVASPSSRLFWGGRVLQGTALCAVTAVGSGTRVAGLIRAGKFPPAASVSTSDDGGDGGGAAQQVDGGGNEDDDDEETGSGGGPADQGISLLSRRLT